MQTKCGRRLSIARLGRGDYELNKCRFMSSRLLPAGGAFILTAFCSCPEVPRGVICGKRRDKANSGLRQLPVDQRF